MPRANLDSNLEQSRSLQQPFEGGIGEAEALIPEAGTNPALVVFAQVEHEQAAPGPQDPDSLRHRVLRVSRVMQRLREKRHVHG